MDSLLTGPQYLPEREGQAEDGQREYELDPPLELIEPEEITLDIAYRVLFALDCDPEAVLFSEETVELPDRPPLSSVETVMNLLVENQGDYEVGKMHPSEVKVMLATITAYFIEASHEKSSGERPTSKTGKTPSPSTPRGRKGMPRAPGPN